MRTHRHRTGSPERPGSFGQQSKFQRQTSWLRLALSAFEQVARRQQDCHLQFGPYSVSLAKTDNDRRAAFRLRFQVFNLELNEGLERARETGEDTDEFDAFCDHLIVRDDETDSVVGTYRLQTGVSAMRNLGFYSAREFDFAPYDSMASQMVELGRACIHPDHRKYEVLMLLWKAITRYAVQRRSRYLIGCSSLTSQDPLVGSATYESLKPMLAPEHLRTLPTEPYGFTLPETARPLRPPKLLRGYLAMGANVCGPPALDREFKTIDFLTLMDLNNLTPGKQKALTGNVNW